MRAGSPFICWAPVRRQIETTFPSGSSGELRVNHRLPRWMRDERTPPGEVPLLSHDPMKCVGAGIKGDPGKCACHRLDTEVGKLLGWAHRVMAS